MMVAKIGIVAMMYGFFSMAILANETNCNKWSFHANELKSRLDTSWWRKFYSDDTWHIRCIFVDMDNDGVEELVAATTSDEEDRAGYVWKIYKNEKEDGFKQMMRRHDGSDIYFLCHWYSFYKVSYSDQKVTVVGLDMKANVEENLGNGCRRIVRPTPDCKFTLMPESKFMLHEIQPDVDTFFQRQDVVGIERLYPEWYFGFDFKPPKDVQHSPFTQRPPYRLPKGDLRRGGGMKEDGGFGAFVEEYRRKVKRNAVGRNNVTVYAVFLDADNDGDADCYVSSDAERTDDGKYKWSLYLRRGETLSAVLDVVYPVEDHKELCKLNPWVTASKDSFCRVIRFDVNPLFVILDDNTERSVIRDTITRYETHRVEKLGCGEYPEK